MDLLPLALTLVGLILVKVLLSGKERRFRRSRAQRKMHHILKDAARGVKRDEREQPHMVQEPKGKPPPLPPKADD